MCTPSCRRDDYLHYLHYLYYLRQVNTRAGRPQLDARRAGRRTVGGNWFLPSLPS